MKNGKLIQIPSKLRLYEWNMLSKIQRHHVYQTLIGLRYIYLEMQNIHRHWKVDVFVWAVHFR